MPSYSHSPCQATAAAAAASLPAEVATSVDAPANREDEPDLRDLVRDALIEGGLIPLRDFRTEASGPCVRVILLAPFILEVALDALQGFDRVGDGSSALRVAFAGDFAADAQEAA